MDDLKLDARRWAFLRKPENYLSENGNDLRREPLIRQFKTVQEILTRFQQGHGVLLADDVGLGKTTIGALVAWVAAHQGLIVRIYAPNDVLRRRWELELKRHESMLSRVWRNEIFTKQGEINKRLKHRIRVMTHHVLKNQPPKKCDVMIVDEAHRAKGEGGKCSEALRSSIKTAKRTLILTATPFSIRIKELELLLDLVGARTDQLSAVREYADMQANLYASDQVMDAETFSKNLIETAEAAIDQLSQFLIRHSVEGLRKCEKKYFGETKLWSFGVEPVNEEQLSLLLRVDRIKHLARAEKGKRKNDPRFHIGWRHLRHELERIKDGVDGHEDADPILISHIDEALNSLRAIEKQAHPKMLAVSQAIRPVIDGGEKVLVFCHHRSTASELLAVLEAQLKADVSAVDPTDEAVWRLVWQELCEEGEWCAFGVDADDDKQINKNKRLIEPFIDWLCTKGVRSQVSQWLTQPARGAVQLRHRLKKDRVRGERFAKAAMPTILEAAESLLKTLLDPQSGSTRATLKNMSKKNKQPGLEVGDSHFPGLLDEGLRVMGAWDHEGEGAPATLYTGRPDIVIALFNSPFGPDVLVATDRMSEGVDLHRYCRHLVHYELDPSPVRTIQRNGRVRRVNSWAARTKQSVEYAYPAFGGTRDEKAVSIMQQRIRVFGGVLGGVPAIKDEELDQGYDLSYVKHVFNKAESSLKRLNGRLSVD